MFSVRIPEELEARLDAEARLDGRPRSDMVREAVAEYLARRERERQVRDMADEMRRAYVDDVLARETRELEDASVEDWARSGELEDAPGATAEKWWA